MTSYLIEHGSPAQRDPFIEQLIDAGLQGVPLGRPSCAQSNSACSEPARLSQEHRTTGQPPGTDPVREAERSPGHRGGDTVLPGPGP